MTGVSVVDHDRVRRYVAERVRVHGSTCISQAMLNRATFDSSMRHELDALVLNLSTYVHGMTKEKVEVHEQWPADWWQALKERWFPAWALRRWPVRYSRIDIDQPIFLAVCPHIEEGDNRPHLQWMAAQWDASEGAV